MPTETVNLKGRVVPINGDPKEVVYSWGFQSQSDPDKVRETILRRSGKVSCNCPSWVFKSGGMRTGAATFFETEERDCLHIRMVEDEIRKISKLFKSGQPLPLNQVAAPSEKARKKATYAVEDVAVGFTFRARRMIVID